MKIGVNTVRIGDIVEFNGKLCLVQKQVHTMPGKGGAFVQLEMKDIKNGTKLNERFRASESIEKAYIDTKVYRYQYEDGNVLMCMNMEDYEQIGFDKGLIEPDEMPFLQEDMDLSVEFYEDEPVSIHLPESVVSTIDQTESVVKGQTVTSSFKPAILDNGVKIMVPQFINQGERVIVRIADRTYVEREKK